MKGTDLGGGGSRDGVGLKGLGETLEFVAEDEDPVTVRFNAEERRQLEQDGPGRLNGF
jgi:hypothetical protein